MNKKASLQIVLLVLLVGGGIYWAASFFKPAKIQILCDIHPARAPRNPRAANPKSPFDVAFGFDKKYELTDLKVVEFDEWTTNKQAHPLWHLVSATNAAPNKAVIYGQGVRGMRPYVSGAHADPLQPNVAYRLLIEAGSQSGECDFKIPALPAAH